MAIIVIVMVIIKINFSKVIKLEINNKNDKI